MISNPQADTATFLAGICLPQLPRALALMDRDPTSPTYGSMDRAYWYYRTLTNFPGAVWQQPMVAFAAMAAARHKSNPHAGDPQLIEAAAAALLAWTNAQHRSGAFDEWYRNEFSYCPTAITTAGAVVTLRLLGDIKTDARSRALESIRRGGNWLARRYNHGVSNQNLASAVALSGLAWFERDGIWEKRTTALLERIANDQSSEGWFPEYGGFDLGYSTLALDFLALAGSFGFQHLTDPMAERLANLLLEIVEGDKAMPGRIGSRGTSHVFLSGAISLSSRIPAMQTLAGRLLGIHAAGLAAGPGDVDDRYFAYFYFPAFALAYHAASSGQVPAPARTAGSPPVLIRHAESGIAIRRQNGSTVAVNRRLGGAAALLRVNSAPLYHLGYTVTERGKRYSSASGHDTSSLSRSDDFHSFATFTKVSGGIPLRWLTIPFQLIIHVLATSRLAELFQSIIKGAMISPKQAVALSMERRTVFAADSVVFQDLLKPARALDLDDIAVTAQITMHSPSGRQDSGTSCVMTSEVKTTVMELLRAGRPAQLHWTLSMTTGQVDVRLLAARQDELGASV